MNEIVDIYKIKKSRLIYIFNLKHVIKNF